MQSLGKGVQWGSALLVLLLVFLSPREDPPEDCPPKCPPPPPCSAARLDRMLGIQEQPGETDANSKDETAEEGCNPPKLPEKPPRISPKASIASLRYRNLFEEFFASDDTFELQKQIIAAELTDGAEARSAAFDAVRAQSDRPEIQWRAGIGLAFTHLRFGQNAEARAAARAALSLVETQALPKQFASDAYFILGMTEENAALALQQFSNAIGADPFSFDANSSLLATAAQLIGTTSNATERGVYLEAALKSIDYLAALEDRSLLIETRLDRASLTQTSLPELAFIDANLLWYSGASEKARETLERADRGCSSQTPSCDLVALFLERISGGSNE